MAGYEYGNTRLRAMRSRLLSRQALSELSEAASLPEFIGRLAQTTYRQALEVSLVQSSDLESIYATLRLDFVETASKIRSFYEGGERKLVDLIFRSYDVFNLKTILRGLTHQASRGDIDRALLPVGDLNETILNELLRASTMRGAIDLLATLRHPFAQPLLTLRAEQPGADLFDMERTLDRWRFNEAQRALKGQGDDRQTVLTALRMEMDLLNIMTVLRFVQSPADREVLRARLGDKPLETLFPALGLVSAQCLQEMFTTKTVKAGLDRLAGTSYETAARAGLTAYEQSGRLSEIEKWLHHGLFNWSVAQITKDPLGIGVVIGYLALKTNEINNIRRAARGIQFNMAHDAILEEMEFAE